MNGNICGPSNSRVIAFKCTPDTNYASNFTTSIVFANQQIANKMKYITKSRTELVFTGKSTQRHLASKRYSEDIVVPRLQAVAPNVSCTCTHNGW